MNIDKKNNFSEWFSKVLSDAGIVDIRFPVKGMPVYRGWGFRAMDLMFRKLEQMLDKYGHEKLLFPIALPKSVFAKESDHIKGFEGEVFWITHGGNTHLDDPLLLRPTSEAAMYHMFNLWINSHGDLPLKIYQTSTVYRYETKATRPLIRGREIYWNEGHSAHASYENAVEHVRNMIYLYSKFFDSLALPYFILRRPEHDKFPGADYTYAFDTLMPSGKMLQIGTVHNLGKHFAKAYNVKFSDQDGNSKYVTQASYGISMRALAAAIGIHGDNKGIIWPISIAPIQIVIVPIYTKGKKEIVDNKGRSIFDLLTREGYKVIYDDGDKRPGEKFYHWELMGVPIRIEIGPRDVENESLVLLTRLGNKKIIKETELLAMLPEVSLQYDEQLKIRAWTAQQKAVMNVSSLDDLKRANSNNEKSIYVSGWCGDVSCANKIKDELSLDILGFEQGLEDNDYKCVVCGKEGKRVLIAKTY